MNDVKELTGGNLTAENVKDFVLFLERENLNKIEREDKKKMVTKILKSYAEALKNDNK